MIVPTGKDTISIYKTLTSVTTAPIADGAIISNDKESIDSVLRTQGGHVRLIGITLYENDTTTPATLNKAPMDIYIFSNLSTVTLGISSGDPFIINPDNQAKYQKVKFDSTDWTTDDPNTASAHKTISLDIIPEDETQYSLSFAIVSRGTATYSLNHTLTIRFDFERYDN